MGKLFNDESDWLLRYYGYLLFSSRGSNFWTYVKEFIDRVGGLRLTIFARSLLLHLVKCISDLGEVFCVDANERVVH